MKRYLKGALLALLAGAIMLFAELIWAQTTGQAQNPPPQKKVVEQKQVQQTDQEPTEEEFNAWEAARDEKEPVKQAAMVLAFMEKYPKSPLKANITNLYEMLLYNLHHAGDYKTLEPLAEQWLKLNPNDMKTQAYLMDAAVALGKSQLVVEYGEKLYAQTPSAALALPIYQAYVKLGNKEKKTEWAQKLLQYPEYSNDLQIRVQLMVECAEKNDLAKAAEYAQQTIKALPGAQKPASMSEAEWSKAVPSVKKSCYDILGMHYYGQKKYADAMQALDKALQIEDYDAAYYYIGQIQWTQNDVDNAIDSYVRAYLLHGKFEVQAKAHAEELYKSQHAGTLVGFDKVIKRNQIYLDNRKKPQ